MTEPDLLVKVHAHVVTTEYVTAARAAGHHQPDGMPGWPSWRALTARNSQRLFDRIDHSGR